MMSYLNPINGSSIFRCFPSRRSEGENNNVKWETKLESNSDYEKTKISQAVVVTSTWVPKVSDVQKMCWIVLPPEINEETYGYVHQTINAVYINCMC